MAIGRKTTSFQASPIQVKALRRAIGWSRGEMGRYLRLYTYDRWCFTIGQWERGRNRPSKWFISQMLDLHARFLPEYEAMLRKLTKEKHAKTIAKAAPSPAFPGEADGEAEQATGSHHCPPDNQQFSWDIPFF